MKNKYSYIFLLVISFSFFSGCSDTNDGDFEEPITVYEKVNGTWGLSSLMYIDEFAKSNNLEPVEENLTNWFNYSSVVLSLNVGEDNIPTDYLMEGNVPELFPSSGYWDLSSAFPTTNTKPLEINLYSDSQKTIQTSTLRLISIPGATNTMEIQLQRKSNDVVFASYNFKFFPVN